MYIAQTNKPMGRGYNTAMGELLTEYKLDDMGETARAHILKIMEHYAAVEEWRAKQRDPADLNHPSGRFKRELETKVVGAGATPIYPRIGSGPWAEPDGIGQEPPLGYDISAAPDLNDASQPPQPLCSSSQEDGGAGGRAPAIAQQSERARPARLRRRMP
jgi:hypothetical protein